MKFFRRWFSSIWRVLIKPTPKTFMAITDDVDGVFGESVILVSVFIALSFTLIISLGYFEKSLYLDLIGGIFLIFLFVLLFNYFIGYISTRIFHNQSIYKDRLYFSLIVIVLISIIIDNLLIIVLPNITFLGYVSTLYTVILLIICIKSLSDLTYWQSIATLILSSICSVVSTVIVGYFFSRLIYLVPYWFDYF